MKIARVTLYRYCVPFVKPFVTSQQTFAERIGLVLQAVTDTGLVGLGEIAPLGGFSRESTEECTTAVLKFVPRLVNSPVLATPLEQTQQVEKSGIAQASLAFGVELLLADLAAQAADLPLSKWHRDDAVEAVSVNAVLTGDDFENQAASKLEAGYRTFKLKIGAHSMIEDLDRIRAVHSAIGKKARLRLDANRAYDLAGARSLLKELEELNIDYIEEPLKTPSLSSLKALRSEFDVPIAIDETVLESSDALVGRTGANELLLDAFDVAILKPALMGGISRSLRLAGTLRQAGKKIVVTSSLDSGIGIAAALQIACALKLESACGLDTGSGLTNQLVESPLIPSGGMLAIPAQPGHGAKLSDHPDTLRMLTKLYEN